MKLSIEVRRFVTEEDTCYNFWGYWRTNARKNSYARSLTFGHKHDAPSFLKSLFIRHASTTGAPLG